MFGRKIKNILLVQKQFPERFKIIVSNGKALIQIFMLIIALEE